jgi:hypothetical protein
MPVSGTQLLAWVVPCDDRTFRAAFVGADATRRIPAAKVYPSRDEAVRWVEKEAAVLGVAVRWVGAPPQVDYRNANPR